jgi:CheY-like chemotaxis protein
VTLQNSQHEGEIADIEVDIHSLSVLIVDDDEVALEHARLVLESAGIAADVTDSAQKAVEMVKVRTARSAPYNLILLDWQMPVMDGVECARQIRSITGDMSAIIMLTAYRWDDVQEEAVLAGIDSFIAKPLFVGNVLDEYRSAAAKKGLAALQEKGKADLEGRRMLLAEDVEINAEIMVMLLEMREVECEIAANGRIALEMFEQSEPGYYDAILMDVRMPEMDGLEATRRIRSLPREDARSIPIIALTANAFDEDVQRSLQAGLNAHLSKPVDPDVLFETLENLL